MSRYRRSAAPKLHKHCESCRSRYCKASIEISVSCLVIKCRLLCGANFHMCKEEEHILLCPNERVPCLNALYGCPFTMCRSRLAQHLQVCPASVVVCSMDWNRWPIENIKAPLVGNLLRDMHQQQALDLSMALRDQKLLCNRMKIRSFFPQLVQEPEDLIPTAVESQENIRGESKSKGKEEYTNCAQGQVLMNGPGRLKLEKPVEPKNFTVDQDKYDIYEKMFSKEIGGCNQSLKESSNLGDDKNNTKQYPSNPNFPKKQGTDTKTVEHKNGNEGRNEAAQQECSKTGLAPWQNGVLDRLSQEVNPREFNMYLVHHGRMLLTFGQIRACTPRDEDFVYGKLEPIPVQTLRSFNVPISYRHKRINRRDPLTPVKTEHKFVDTSDLEASGEKMQKTDEMFSTLLCAAELEVRGHKISQTVATDGLYVDIATQTYDFPGTPFCYNATLADVTAEEDLKLYLQTDTECVTLRHNKFNSTFAFVCGHCFRRDEFASHFKNVHLDIQSCLNGWFEQRCPLAYLGCTFTHRRLRPSSHRATVAYMHDHGIFTLKPEILNETQVNSTQETQAGFEESLSDLPFEVLRHIARYLDSFSLSQLALVSHLFRDVCATFLHERGIVSLQWRKKLYSHGGTKWKSSTVWEFSSLFSTVSSWCIEDTCAMAEHLKHCPFYQTELKTEPVALTSMYLNNEDSKKRKSLVTQFMKHR